MIDILTRVYNTFQWVDTNLSTNTNKQMPKKATSLKVAKIASKLLRNPKSSTNVKKVSASDLSQREKGKKKR